MFFSAGTDDQMPLAGTVGCSLDGKGGCLLEKQ